MKKSLALVIPFLLLTSCSKEEAPIPSIELKDDDLTFMIASDIHYLDPSLTDETVSPLNKIDISGDGQMTYYSSIIFDAFLEKVKEKKPDALILTGDNTSNGSKVSHDALINKLTSIQKEGIPVYVLAGNHDVGFYPAYEYKNLQANRIATYNQNEFKELYSRFGYKQAEYKDSNSNTYIKEIGKNIYGIMLDSNAGSIYTVSDATLKWLDETLNELNKKDATIVSFSHQNLLTQIESMDSGYKIIDSEKVLSVYKKHDVKANFAGHMHIEHYVKDDGFLEVLTSALSVNPCQFGILALKEGDWKYNTEKLDISSYARSEGYTDKNLLNFESFSEEFFDKTNSLKLSSFLYDDESLNDETRDRYVSTIALLNRHIFSGEPITIDSDISENINELETYLESNEGDSYLLETISEIRKGIDYRSTVVDL